MSASACARSVPGCGLVLGVDLLYNVSTCCGFVADLFYGFRFRCEIHASAVADGLHDAAYQGERAVNQGGR